MNANAFARSAEAQAPDVGSAERQLFDLQEDPYELKDLSGDPAQAGRIKELMSRMEEQQRLFGDKQPLTTEDPRPAEIKLEWLKRQMSRKE